MYIWFQICYLWDQASFACASPVFYQNAVSMYCRLGFAVKKGQVFSSDQLHPTWKNAPSVNRLKYVLSSVSQRNTIWNLSVVQFVEIHFYIYTVEHTKNQHFNGSFERLRLQKPPHTNVILIKIQCHQCLMSFNFPSFRTWWTTRVWWQCVMWWQCVVWWQCPLCTVYCYVLL